jgi:hypothetical protein
MKPFDAAQGEWRNEINGNGRPGIRIMNQDTGNHPASDQPLRTGTLARRWLIDPPAPAAASRPSMPCQSPSPGARLTFSSVNAECRELHGLRPFNHPQHQHQGPLSGTRKSARTAGDPDGIMGLKEDPEIPLTALISAQLLVVRCQAKPRRTPLPSARLTFSPPGARVFPECLSPALGSRFHQLTPSAANCMASGLSTILNINIRVPLSGPRKARRRWETLMELGASSASPII